MERAYISEFPLKVKPCKYWWVRYAVACTYVNEKVEEILWDLVHKFYPGGTDLISSKFVDVTVEKLTAADASRMDSETFVNMFKEKTVKVQKHFLVKKGKEIEIKNPLVLKLLDTKISLHLWADCPFENKDQSKCPFYKEDEFYKDVPLKTLRKPVKRDDAQCTEN